jgi:hypothetical protein
MIFLPSRSLGSLGGNVYIDSREGGQDICPGLDRVLELRRLGNFSVLAFETTCDSSFWFVIRLRKVVLQPSAKAQ